MSPAKGEKLIEVKGLEKHFKHVEVLRGINIDICKGDVVAVIGPSGSGKSTFLRCLNLLEEPTGGQIVFEGVDITSKETKIDQMRQKIGMVFQQFNLFTNMTVLDNVKVGLHNQVKYTTATGILRLPSYFVKERAMNEKAMELLKIFDLDGEAGQPASSLPYGKQRKLEIARALATNPKLLLLDEHTAALDPATAEKVLRLTREIVEGERITCLMITHNMKNALELGSRTFMMDAGRVVLDIGGEERKGLTVDDLLERFRAGAGKNLDNDRILLSND